MAILQLFIQFFKSKKLIFKIEKVKVLSQSALETLVRDEKYLQNGNGLQEPLFEAKSLRAQTLFGQVSFALNFELNELHSKGFDVKELLREMLKQQKEKIKEGKEEIAKIMIPDFWRRCAKNTMKSHIA